ncbi:unnamed protein product [Closterium sp. Naga37s-1]|nr:unnamed protein product [Closterium sp. Naga37s-1]
MADGGWGVRRRLAIWESRADSFRDKSSADAVRTSTSGSGTPEAPSGAPAQYGASTAVGSTATANGGRRWEQWDRTYDNVHFSTPRDGQFGGPGASSSYVPEDPRYTPTANPPGYPVDWKPKEVFFKFRQRFMQYKLGANVELRRKLDPPQLSTASLSPKAPAAPKHNPLSLWGFQVSIKVRRTQVGYEPVLVRFLQYKLGANVELRRKLDPPQLSTFSPSPKSTPAPKHSALSVWGFQVSIRGQGSGEGKWVWIAEGEGSARCLKSNITDHKWKVNFVSAPPPPALHPLLPSTHSCPLPTPALHPLLPSTHSCPLPTPALYPLLPSTHSCPLPTPALHPLLPSTHSCPLPTPALYPLLPSTHSCPLPTPALYPLLPSTHSCPLPTPALYPLLPSTHSCPLPTPALYPLLPSTHSCPLPTPALYPLLPSTHSCPLPTPALYPLLPSTHSCPLPTPALYPLLPSTHSCPLPTPALYPLLPSTHSCPLPTPALYPLLPSTHSCPLPTPALYPLLPSTHSCPLPTPAPHPPLPSTPFRSPPAFSQQVNSANLKLVLKPNITDRKWKVIFEPQRGDIRFLTRKIPIMGLLNLQVGIGHDFKHNATGWKWKLTSALNGNTPSEIRYKHNLPVCPGVDVRVGWNAEYVLPDMHGALGTGEPILGLNVGRLYASVERLEAIFTSID